MNIFKKIFTKSLKSNKERSIIRHKKSHKKDQPEKPQDIDLNSVEYIPLPPSPKTWEVDGRNEFHAEYQIPELKEIFQAGWEKKWFIP